MSKLKVFILIGLGFIVLVWYTLQMERAAVDACRLGGGTWDAELDACNL